MKTIRISSIIILVALVSFSGCTPAKKVNGKLTLYKTDEGRAIAHGSYDNALELIPADFSEEYIETDYGLTHLLISGSADSEALFILPGLFGDATMWYPNLEALSAHYRVYAVDMPNYGGKSQPAGASISSLDDYIIWFKQLLNHYDLSSVNAMGISYSSWLVLAMAREIPGNFESIIMLDPSETFMPMNGGIAWKGFKYFMFFPNRKKYAKFLDWLGGGYSDPELLKWREHMLDVIEYGSTKMFDVPQHRIYDASELETVKMPVLIMAGGKPILYSDPGQFKANAINALPHAEVIIVPGAGHGLNVEKPEYVNSQVISFLNRQSLE